MIQISTDKTQLDVNWIHTSLSKEAYWAIGREMVVVKRSIENSLCFSVFLNDQQIGFARVVTDYAVFGWIMDVFIQPNLRGNGYGKQLMEAILSHPALQTLKRWGLGTDDAHGLYRQFGFTALSKPENMMEIKNY